MKHLWGMFFLISFWALPTSGEELVDTELFNEETPLDASVIGNPDDSFYHENEQFGHVELIERPKCDSIKLFNKIKETAEKYLFHYEQASTLAKREKSLLMSNLKGFEEISAINFSFETDLNTANAIISLKINNNIREGDFVLCKQTDAKKTPIYVLLYPYLNNYKGFIINLVKNNDNLEDFSFIYP